MKMDTKISELDKMYAEQKQISDKTSDLLTLLHKFLLAAGWKRTDDRRMSAMFLKTYERDQRQIVISGWHGTGTGIRNFGNLKLLFDVADNQPSGKGPREPYPKEYLRLDTIGGTIADAEAFYHAVKNYITTTCGRN